MKTLPTPPAVWLAFVRAGRWKSWALGLSLLLNLFIALVALGAMAQDPDVVLIDETTGESHYVARSLAGTELVRFLHQMKHTPTDLEASFFARQFLERLLAINSTTVEDDLLAATGMMTADYAAEFLAHAEESHLFETYVLASVRSELRYKALEIREKSDRAIHVRAALVRSRRSLSAPRQPAAVETLDVDLVLALVPRTSQAPSGMKVRFVRVAAGGSGDPSEGMPTTQPDHHLGVAP